MRGTSLFGLVRESSILVVYQAPWDWDFLRNRSQPLAEALIRRGVGVVYSNCGVTLGGGVMKVVSRIPRVRSWLGKWFHSPRFKQDESGVLVVSWESCRRPSPWFVASQDRPISAYRKFSSVLRDLAGQYEQVWLLTSRPLARGLLTVYPWDRVLVDLEDPWWEFEGGEGCKHASQDLLTRADFVFGNGPRISTEATNRTGRPVHSLPNGIDPGFIASMKAPLGSRPTALGQQSRSRVAVYTGNINVRIDYELIGQILSLTDGWKFVFIGPTNLSSSQKPLWAKLRAHPRFRYHPPVAHDQLPDILRHADALLLPYTKYGGNLMFPAKLLEYVCAGKPILTSEDYTAGTMSIPTLRVCQTPEAYALTLSACTGERTGFEAEGIALAEEHTWDRRAEQFLTTVSGGGAC